jgi:hypothetical protein
MSNYNNFPKKIKILNQIYSILFSLSAEQLKLDSSLSNACGACHKEEKWLYFDSSNKTENTLDTVLHELLHGIWKEFNIPKDKEEKCVTMLAKGLSSVLEENPKLMQWINNQCKSKAKQYANLS